MCIGCAGRPARICARQVQLKTDLVSNNQFIISLSGEDYSSEELVAYADTIKDQLEDIDHVASVSIEGASTKPGCGGG